MYIYNIIDLEEKKNYFTNLKLLMLPFVFSNMRTEKCTLGAGIPG